MGFASNASWSTVVQTFGRTESQITSVQIASGQMCVGGVLHLCTHLNQSIDVTETQRAVIQTVSKKSKVNHVLHEAAKLAVPLLQKQAER